MYAGREGRLRVAVCGTHVDRRVCQPWQGKSCFVFLLRFNLSYYTRESKRDAGTTYYTRASKRDAWNYCQSKRTGYARKNNFIWEIE